MKRPLPGRKQPVPQSSRPSLPLPKPQTREMRQQSNRITQPVNRQARLLPDLNHLPILATVHQLLNAAEMKYPGLKDLFYCQDTFEMYMDITQPVSSSSPIPDQIFITSGWLSHKLLARQRECNRWIGIGKYVQMDNQQWRHSPVFFLAGDGFPLYYEEYDPTLETKVTLPVVTLTSDMTPIHKESRNKPHIYKLSVQLVEYIEKNRYAKRAQFSGLSIDQWHEIQRG